MYGWFEPGGGVNKFFTNTKMIDVLLRSSTLSNNIVIGNGSSGTAAIYVSNNSLGVQKIPNPQYAIDVDAPSHFDFIDMGKIQLCSSNISAGSNLYIDNFGTIQNEIIITKNIKQPLTTLTGIVVSSISLNPEGFLRVSFDFVPSLTSISLETTLKIRGTLYVVKNIVNSNTFILSCMFESQGQLPFLENDILSIDLLVDFSFETDNEHVITWFYLQPGYGQPSVQSFTMTIELFDAKQMSYLVAGCFYSFSSNQGRSTNILQLDSVIVTSSTIATVTLKTIDGTVFPVGILSYIMQLVLLDVMYPFISDENNIVGGTYNDAEGQPYFYIKNSSLARNVNQMPNIDKPNPVTKITFNNSVTYSVARIFKNNDGFLLAKLSNLNTSYEFSTRGNMTYQLVGNPIGAVTPVVGNAIPGQYTFSFLDDDQNIASQLNIYIGGYIYFSGICIIAKLFNVTVTDVINTFTIDTNISRYCGGFLYVVPFKPSVIATLGQANCCIPESLAIGTKIPTERLTVNGNVSLTGTLVMKSKDSRVPFIQKYSSNVFNLNDGLLIHDDLVTINQNMTVNGTIIADAYHSFSDEKIKRKIKKSNPLSDLEMIRNIKIYNFLLKDKNVAQKGVLAQEIEELIPDIVYETRGFIPSICKEGRVTSSGSIGIIGLEKSVILDLHKEKYLRVMVDGKKKDILMTRVREKKGTLFIRSNNHFGTGKLVYVFGPLSSCKTIDKDYLFMMLFNAVKALAEK